MICPNCQSHNRESAKFCDECGALLRPAPGEEDRGALDFDFSEISDADEGSDSSACAVSAPVARDAEKGAEAPEGAADVAGGPEGSEAPDDPDEAAMPDDASEQGFPSAEQNDRTDASEDPDLAGEAAPNPDPGAPRPAPDAPASLKFLSNAADTTTRIDLSGLDASGYGLSEFGEAVVPAATAPRPVWNDGRTIEFPRVTDEEKPRSKDFLASDSKKKRLGRGKIALLVTLVLLALAAIAAAATYQMELWGGKTVPDVTGLTQSEAQAVLGDAGFTVKALQVKSDEPEGLVLVMDPEAGERQGAGTEVIIHVSTARIVPDIAGKSKEDAERQLKDEGFTSVTFAEEKSDEPEGTVLGVSPAPGERAASTTEIQVTVAIPHTVPEVSGKSADAAQKALEEAGYRCEIQYSYSDQVDNGTVLGCSPSPGSKLESGSTVVLNVSKSRGAELVAAVQAYVYKGQQITVGGVSYEVQSLSGVKYIGNNQTSVQFVGKPFMSFLGETVSLSARDVEAVITWTESNTVASVS